MGSVKRTVTCRTLFASPCGVNVSTCGAAPAALAARAAMKPARRRPTTRASMLTGSIIRHYFPSRTAAAQPPARAIAQHRREQVQHDKRGHSVHGGAKEKRAPGIVALELRRREGADRHRNQNGDRGGSSQEGIAPQVVTMKEPERRGIPGTLE